MLAKLVKSIDNLTPSDLRKLTRYLPKPLHTEFVGNSKFEIYIAKELDRKRWVNLRFILLGSITQLKSKLKIDLPLRKRKLFQKKSRLFMYLQATYSA